MGHIHIHKTKQHTAKYPARCCNKRVAASRGRTKFDSTSVAYFTAEAANDSWRKTELTVSNEALNHNRNATPWRPSQTLAWEDQRSRRFAATDRGWTPRIACLSTVQGYPGQSGLDHLKRARFWSQSEGERRCSTRDKHSHSNPHKCAMTPIPVQRQAVLTTQTHTRLTVGFSA